MTKYKTGETGICPHCGVAVQFAGVEDFSSLYVSVCRLLHGNGSSEEETLLLHACICPNCNKIVIGMELGENRIGYEVPYFEASSEYLLWPRFSVRPIPKEVPKHIRQDYAEAVGVLAISSKASAALSRRCLQTVLREEGSVDQYNLFDQIENVKPSLPSYLRDRIDDIRQFGNYAAHAKKNTRTGEIIEVENGEAEWLLDILDLLFDFYYVQPAKAQAMKSSLEAKKGR